MPKDIEQQREIAYRYLEKFAQNRISYYSNPKRGITLEKLLSKDIIMFASRGVSTSDDYVDEAFRAIESSSEETVMGNTWQAIIAAISEDTIDTGDLTTVRENTIWVCELKAQPNTTNSASFPQEIRELKEKLRIQGRYQRASHQPIRPAFCILRSARSIDEERVFKTAEGDTTNTDLNGFAYRHLEGKAFWQWLTGVDSVEGLIDDVSRINIENIVEVRTKAILSLKEEMNRSLDEHGLPHTIAGVLNLKRLFSSTN